mgnify:CR=1 FL=1
MSEQLSKGNLFDPELVKKVISKVKGHSSIAKLSPQKPIPFNGQREFVFDFDSDIDIVAENGKKTHGGVSLEPVTIVPLKVEYGVPPKVIKRSLTSSKVVSKVSMYSSILGCQTIKPAPRMYQCTW